MKAMFLVAFKLWPMLKFLLTQPMSRAWVMTLAPQAYLFRLSNKQKTTYKEMLETEGQETWQIWERLVSIMEHYQVSDEMGSSERRYVICWNLED